MAEMVFYDQRLPLTRRWNTTCEDVSRSPNQTQTPLPVLPRLPSLSDWANLRAKMCEDREVLVKNEPAATLSPKQEQPEPAAKPTPTPTPTPMRNTSRERMKAEQASLRAQAESLEKELASLRQHQQDKLRRKRPSSCSTTSSNDQDQDQGWQEAAQQQWEARVDAERENKRLRTTVCGLSTEVKSLESLFKSRSSALTASLRQHSHLALQLQALMAADDRHCLYKTDRTSPRPPAISMACPTSASIRDVKLMLPHQQSPRDVSMREAS